MIFFFLFFSFSFSLSSRDSESYPYSRRRHHGERQALDRQRHLCCGQSTRSGVACSWATTEFHTGNAGRHCRINFRSCCGRHSRTGTCRCMNVLGWLSNTHLVLTILTKKLLCSEYSFDTTNINFFMWALLKTGHILSRSMNIRGVIDK